MILISYSNDPSVTNMKGNSIQFKDKFFLHGDYSNDTLVIDFHQPDSPSVQITGSVRRQFPIARPGSHTFGDALTFQRTNAGEEVFNVRSTAYLLSKPDKPIETVLTVITN